MGYTAANILNANSPTIGNDKTTFAAIFDASFQAVDEHDHTTGKGVIIRTAALDNLAVTTAKIDNDAVTNAKLADNAVTTSKIVDANVTTVKILDANITTPKLVDNAVTTVKITDLNVTTAKLANDAVTTAKIANGAVTQAKRAALNIVYSAGVGTFSTTNSGSYVAVTNMSLTFSTATTGRPIFVGIASLPEVSGGGAVYSSTGNGDLRLIQNGSVEVAHWDVGAIRIPSGCVWTIIQTTGDNHTFALEAKAPGGGSISVDGVILVAYEL